MDLSNGVRLVYSLLYTCLSDVQDMALFVEMTLEVHQKIPILVLGAFFLFPTVSLLQPQLEANPE